VTCPAFGGACFLPRRPARHSFNEGGSLGEGGLFVKVLFLFLVQSLALMIAPCQYGGKPYDATEWRHSNNCPLSIF